MAYVSPCNGDSSSPYFIIKGEMVWFVILRATGQAVNVEQTSANSNDCLPLLPFGRLLTFQDYISTVVI